MQSETLVMRQPVNDGIAVEVLQRLQQGDGNLQDDPALAHGAPLIQQAVQEVSARAVLHDQKDLVCILERPVELCDERHPAKR
jgi:hypothetical protein